MPKERYFIDEDIIAQQQYVIEGKEYHHLAKVMRANIGDVVEIINGKGFLGKAQVQSLEKRQGILLVKEIIEEKLPKKEIILVQALPRANRLSTILEKGTELGMTSIWLFPGERSEKKKLSEQDINRMKSITIAATKQCGRLYLPKIEVKPFLKDWSKPDGNSFFGDIDPQAEPFIQRWQENSQQDNKILFFIGPEAGLTNNEINILNSWGSHGVKLHKNILRTDTAPLVALSLIHYSINFL